MTFSLEKHPDLPAVVLTQNGNQVLQEMNSVLELLIPLLDSQSAPVYLIMDERGVSINLDDIVVAANRGAGGPGAVLHHPNVIETLIVTNDGLIKLAAQGMRSAIFGGTKVRVFDTPANALDYCKERAAESTRGSTAR